MLSEIKMVKFVNGEAVVAQVTSTTDKEITIKNPVVIHISEDSMSLVPWPLFVGEDVKSIDVKTDRLLISPVDVDSRIRNAYNKMYGTGIILEKSLGGFAGNVIR